MFFGTLFGMSSKMTRAITSFTTIFFFLQYLHCAIFSTSPFEFSLFIIVKLFQTKEVRLLTLGFFPTCLELEEGTD